MLCVTTLVSSVLKAQINSFNLDKLFKCLIWNVMTGYTFFLALQETRQKAIPCFPLEMSTYWQSLGWVMVLRIWKRPRILMELGVRGSPLLPQTSCGRAEAKKVKAPSWASLRERIVPLAWKTDKGKQQGENMRKTWMKETLINTVMWYIIQLHPVIQHKTEVKPMIGAKRLTLTLLLQHTYTN